MTNTMKNTTNRLETIANRQSKSRVRDFFFAACVTLAAALSIATVSTASNAATPSVAQR
jgi:hypothetical protein